MDKEFNVGDEVIYIGRYDISLGVVSSVSDKKALGIMVEFLNKTGGRYNTIYGNYTSDGLESFSVDATRVLFHNTEENYNAIETLYGKGCIKDERPGKNTPKDNMIKLLEESPHIALVSAVSEDDAREAFNIALITAYLPQDGVFFGKSNWDTHVWAYAIPIDEYGNEIKIIDDGEV